MGYMLSQHMSAKAQLASILAKVDFSLMDEDSDGSAQITELHERHQEREKSLAALSQQLAAKSNSRGNSKVQKSAAAATAWIQQQAADDSEEEEDLDAAFLAENLAQLGDRFVGTIRTYEERNGYGFI